jgi:hypothetical protein
MRFAFPPYVVIIQALWGIFGDSEQRCHLEILDNFIGKKNLAE